MPRAINQQDTAGVIARPPLLYLVTFAVGLGLSILAPAPILPRGRGIVFGVLLIVIAVSLSVWGVREMRRAGTSESTSTPATALVTTGPFRFSRNPLYTSLTLCYVGIALAARSLWSLLLLPVVLVIMHWGVIFREECYLERRFGEDYVRYKARVRRWL